MKNIIEIDANATGRCQLCGKLDELRPYGPNQELICFACGMKDKATTTKQLRKLLSSCDELKIRDGDTTIIIVGGETQQKGME